MTLGDGINNLKSASGAELQAGARADICAALSSVADGGHFNKTVITG